MSTGIQLKKVGIAILSLCAATGCSDRSKNEVGGIDTSNRIVAPSDGSGSEKPVQVTLPGGGQIAVGDQNTLKYLGSTEPQAQAQLVEWAKRFAVEPIEAPAIASENADAGLILSYPVGLLGEESVFGGVITAVSDSQSELLGRLKLVDLPPVHVKTAIVQSKDQRFFFALMGCLENCTETSPSVVVSALPILGIDPVLKRVIINLSALSRDLEIVYQVDPDGEYSGLKPKSFKTVSFDFTDSTLIFDVESKMIPKDSADTDPDAPVTTIRARWYLKLTSWFDSSFISRAPSGAAGYFTTERSAETKITRFSLAGSRNAIMKYYVKNVPDEYKEGFVDAFKDWNARLQPVLGRPMIEWEFIDRDDPRNELLVTGDIRYNIIEWDLVNMAPYGGLGPSIGHQFTGQMLSANVLVQGPTIETLYRTWFSTVSRAQALRAAGKHREAEILLRDTQRAFKRSQKGLELSSLEVRAGRAGKMRVPAADRALEDRLEDPLAQRPDFDKPPEGYDYARYMRGYFHDLVAHEVGHNLGLRHNFRGNLGAQDHTLPGGVSRSIMEYLGRPFRYLDLIGDYDVMAIAFGYSGIAPDHDDWFCTDDDVAGPESPELSAECSRDDATRDPFSFLKGRLSKALDYILARGSVEAPVWKVGDMARELGIGVNGLALYATSAEATASSWTNFFTGGDRPSTPAGVKDYAVSTLKAVVCDPTIAQAIALKSTEEARALTQENVVDFRNRVRNLLAPYAELVDFTSLECQ